MLIWNYLRINRVRVKKRISYDWPPLE